MLGKEGDMDRHPLVSLLPMGLGIVVLAIIRHPWQLAQRVMRSQTTTGQFLRFCIVGSGNAALDLAILNGLLLAIPTRNIVHLLIYNSFAVLVAGSSSFVCNKYWTFRRRTRVTWMEIRRFVILMTFMTTLNDSWFAILSHLFPSLARNQTIGGNILKCAAIVGTMLFSFLGQKLWVFFQRPKKPQISSIDFFVDYEETLRLPVVPVGNPAQSRDLPPIMLLSSAAVIPIPLEPSQESALPDTPLPEWNNGQIYVRKLRPVKLRHLRLVKSE
jgi:putative flippase GtrA